MGWCRVLLEDEMVTCCHLLDLDEQQKAFETLGSTSVFNVSLSPKKCGAMTSPLLLTTPRTMNDAGKFGFISVES